MEKKFYSFILLLFFTFSLYAQTNRVYTIKGQVVDSLTNETIPYATLRITLASDPQTPVKLQACDDDGNFETSLNAPGDYLVLIQSVGKTPSTKAFTIAANAPLLNMGTVYLTEGDQRLGEVVVTAQKPLVRVEIDKISYSLEDDPEAKTNTTLEMLRKVPMVTVDGEDKIQLKGSGNFKIYLNGKPSNMLSGNNASDVLKSMPASSVKSIEIITDPGARYDAEGVGGIINIITSKNALQGYNATLNAEASSLGRYRGGGYFTTKAGKLGLTANYNYIHNNNPWTRSESTREQYGEYANILTQKGRSKNEGNFQFGALEASYEIDTLNLLSVSGNLFYGNSTNRSELEAVRSGQANDMSAYSYNRQSKSLMTFGSIDVNADYQHTTSKKDELLTISYRFSHSPDDNESETYLSDVIDYPGAILFPKWNINKASTGEHTVQVDYTTPLRKDHTLETGLKYIMRQSNSRTTERIFNDSTSRWDDIFTPMGDFKHTQHIYSAYFAYAIKHNNWGFKAGVRGEGTALNVAYALQPELGFDSRLFDVVPNVTVSYQINMAQQLRLGYNMRVYLPGIWYLNPYVNDTDPQNISYGNPNLRSEKSHGINFNYSLFTQKFNFNANASYRFVNNSIESYRFVNQTTGVNESTYDNMGKNQSIGGFLYGRWNPVPLFNVSLNGGINYIDIKGERGLSNSGVSGNAFLNAQFMLPKDFSVNLNAGYFSPQIRLQSKGSSYMFHGITLNKTFLNKALTVALSAQSPFKKNLRFTNTTEDATFHEQSISEYRMQDFRIRVSYRFGSLKDSIKKVRRGISNDDVRSGGNTGVTGGVEGQ
ncbi:MAG: TonB-dependent receptor [Tannerellaceae bacterium]|jgi:outer membrane receptor protein involved in Fe transport|nr:TonB-dependent receptor [Tannerellaceae bacterium]